MTESPVFDKSEVWQINGKDGVKYIVLRLQENPAICLDQEVGIKILWFSIDDRLPLNKEILVTNLSAEKTVIQFLKTYVDDPNYIIFAPLRSEDRRQGQRYKTFIRWYEYYVKQVPSDKDWVKGEIITHTLDDNNDLVINYYLYFYSRLNPLQENVSSFIEMMFDENVGEEKRV